jgi:predicted transcriptional regulator
MLFGKTTPAELREKTGLGKATIFRNLALLLKVAIVEKEEDLTVADKRYSLHYYISQNLLNLSKQMCSSELIDYAKATDQSQIVEDWLTTLDTFPLALNRFTSELILAMRHPSSPGLPSTCQKVAKIMMFRLEDVEDFSALIEKVKEFAKDLDVHIIKGERDWKKPLRHPEEICSQEFDNIIRRDKIEMDN